MNDVESPLFSVFMCVRWYTTLLYYFFSSPLSITVVVYSIIHSVVVVHSDKAGNDTLGPMRVLGSIGCKINHEYASELIQRAVFLVSAIACG